MLIIPIFLDFLKFKILFSCRHLNKSQSRQWGRNKNDGLKSVWFCLVARSVWSSFTQSLELKQHPSQLKCEISVLWDSHMTCSPLPIGCPSVTWSQAGFSLVSFAGCLLHRGPQQWQLGEQQLEIGSPIVGTWNSLNIAVNTAAQSETKHE